MKKSGQVTIHLDPDSALLFAKLVELESDLETKTPSGLGRKLIMEYLANKKSQYESMQMIFNPPESESR